MDPRGLIEMLVSAWEDGDALRSSAFFAPDATYQEAGHDLIAGREAICAHFQRFFRDGPQWRFELDDVLVQGERAAVCYRFGIKGAGGEWSERAGCAYLRLQGGLVQIWREYHG